MDPHNQLNNVSRSTFHYNKIKVILYFIINMTEEHYYFFVMEIDGHGMRIFHYSLDVLMRVV